MSVTSLLLVMAHGTTDPHDLGDMDDGRPRPLRPDDRVLWRGHSKRGTVVAVIASGADAGDIWIRWDGEARPSVYRPFYASQFEAL